jgi:hypothetical protein
LRRARSSRSGCGARRAYEFGRRAEAPKPKEAQQVFTYLKRKAKARFYADENFPEQAIALLREMGAKVQTSRRYTALAPDRFAKFWKD